MNLSENFTLEEFLRSPKADELGILNNPSPFHIDNMKALCINVLQPIRRHFDNLPINIKSGFRCPALNEAVGGAPTSQHLAGEAADIEIKGIRNDKIWAMITTRLNYDQCIAEHLDMDDDNAGWIHVSYSRKLNRKQPLSCIGKGKYVPGLVYV